MKRLIILLVILPSISFAQDFDFRKVKWGYSKSQVKNSESMEAFMDEGNIIGYNTKIAGKECLLGYYFMGEKLYKAAYIIQEEHSNKNEYLNDYWDLKALLKQKYGEPNEDEINWKNDLYSDDKEDYGMAVSVGHLELWSTWELDGQQIQIDLEGENYKISLNITYQDIKLTEEALKKKTGNILDDL